MCWLANVQKHSRKVWADDAEKRDDFLFERKNQFHRPMSKVIFPPFELNYDCFICKCEHHTFIQMLLTIEVKNYRKKDSLIIQIVGK